MSTATAINPLVDQDTSPVPIAPIQEAAAPIPLGESSSFRHESSDRMISRVQEEEVVKTLLGVIETREDLLFTLNSLKSLDTVQTIVDIFMEDAFGIDADKDFFSVAYERKEPLKDDSFADEMNGEIEDLLETLNFREAVKSVLDEFLILGEYPLKAIHEEGQGIVALDDCLDPATTFGIYHLNDPLYYLLKKKDRFYRKESQDIFHLTLSPRKIRLRTVKGEDEGCDKRLPRFARVGRSLFYSAIGKLKRLQIVELASLSKDLRKALAPILLTVNIPANTTTKDLGEIIQKYETYLQTNLYQGIDFKTATIAEIMYQLQQVKVLPNFSDGKGGISTLPLEDESNWLEERQDWIRKLIAITVGFPPSYLSLTETPSQEKVNVLKIHSRYTRKLITIQDAVANAVQRFVLTHLWLKLKIRIRPSNLKVRFKTILNVDMLESMEFAVASVQTLQDVFQVFEQILASEHVRLRLDPAKFLKFLKQFLRTFEGMDADIEDMFELIDNPDTSSQPGKSSIDLSGLGAISTPEPTSLDSRTAVVKQGKSLLNRFMAEMEKRESRIITAREPRQRRARV